MWCHIRPIPFSLEFIIFIIRVKLLGLPHAFRPSNSKFSMNFKHSSK